MNLLNDKETTNTFFSNLLSGMTLAEVCSEEGMPKLSDVLSALWKETDESKSFRISFNRYIGLRIESILNESIRISDNYSADYLHHPDGSRKPNRLHLTRCQLQINARNILYEHLQKQILPESME